VALDSHNTVHLTVLKTSPCPWNDKLVLSADQILQNIKSRQTGSKLMHTLTHILVPWQWQSVLLCQPSPLFRLENMAGWT